MTKRVLTVDDSRTMRDMLALTLGQAGYEVIQAEDGQQGLDLLTDNDVDLMITDIHMPVMDGLTFIKNVRMNPDFRAIPILILTTESSDELKSQGREVGATGWIVKPFDPGKLLNVVRRVSP